MAFVTFGCRPARDLSWYSGNIGVGACQIGIRAWFVQSILRILFYSRKVLVMTSFGCHDFRIWCHSAQLCKPFSVWIVTFWLKYKNSCRDCASAVTCLICGRLSTSDRCSATCILGEWWAESVLLDSDMFWKSQLRKLIKASCRFELAMPLCNMRSLGIAGGVGSISKSWETEKSWWYELVKTNWSSKAVISFYDMRSPEMASRAMS